MGGCAQALLWCSFLLSSFLLVEALELDLSPTNPATTSGVCAILDEGGRDTLHQKCPRHSASVRPLPSARILRRALAIKPARATMALLAKD